MGVAQGPLADDFTNIPPRKEGGVLRGEREHRWRCTIRHIAVVIEHAQLLHVAHTNSGRLGARPQLKVLRSVVVSDAIDVGAPTRHPRGSAPRRRSATRMLENVRTSSAGVVTGARQHHVARLWRARPPFQLPFASPASVRHVAHVADFACLGLPQEHTSRSAPGTSQMSARWRELPPTLLAGPHGHASTIWRGCDSQDQHGACQPE